MIELEVQKYLREGHCFNDLSAHFEIKTTSLSGLPLHILNYSQLSGGELKRHPLVRECRALTLEEGSWDVVARSFPRFFNYGECPEFDEKFNWKDFTVEEKVDGSLMVLYNYNNEWRVNTRGSDASGEICPGLGKSWSDVFWELISKENVYKLNNAFSYSFEFCTKYNKVVAEHSEPHLVLLGAFHNKEKQELYNDALDDLAKYILGVRRPNRYQIRSIEDAIKYIDGREATFEGFVFNDDEMRIKVKNPRYVALHHLKGNGVGFANKNLIPLILNGEIAEVLNFFPESSENIFNLVEKMEGEKSRMKVVWEEAKKLDSQKDFALYVNKYAPKSASILFQARKTGREPEKVWGESEDFLIKRFS